MDTILTITHFINGLFMVAIPIALAIYIVHRWKLNWRLWWIGAGAFVLSQVGHIPFNAAISSLFRQEIFPPIPESGKLVFNAVFLGLSAGIWEEGARYATYRWWAKKARSFPKAFLLGAGHGGIEAIILGGLVLYTYIQLVALRGADLSKLVPANQLAALQAQVSTYWSLPWYMSLLGAFERIMALLTQISLSILVWQAFARRQGRWILAAVGWHALIDALAVFSVSKWGALATEGILLLFMPINILILFVFRPSKIEPIIPVGIEETPSLPSPIKKLEDIDETPTSLDNTRFT